jgi:hypothetical protein
MVRVSVIKPPPPPPQSSYKESITVQFVRIVRLENASFSFRLYRAITLLI